MFPHPSPTTNFNPYNHHDGRYRVKSCNASSEGWFSDDEHGALQRSGLHRSHPESDQNSGDYGALGCPQYVNETLNCDDLERLRKRTDADSRPEYKNPFITTLDSSEIDFDSQFSNKNDEEKKKTLSHKELLLTDENVSVENQIRICAQKLFDETLTREGKKEAEARENEEHRKEADATYKVTLEKALNDQAAAFRKQIENHKHAAQAEMERLRQKKESDEIRFKEAVAAEVEADRKVERERARKIRGKLEREKLEEEKRKVQAVQYAEELYAARLKQEADELAAKKKAEEDKITTENTNKVFELTRLLISIFETNEAQRDKGVSKKTKSINSLALDDVSQKLLVQVKKILDEKSDSSVGEQKAVIEAEQDSKVEEASLKSEGNSKSNVKAESMYVRVKRDDCVSRDAAKHGNKTSSAKTRESSRNQKHAEKVKGGKVHRKHKDEQREEKTSKKSQDRAIAAMQWFIST